MNPHIRPADLSSCRQDELVLVSGQMAEPVQRRRRPMGHDSLTGLALPSKRVGRELEPRGAQRNVVRRRSSGQVIHAVSDSLQDRTVCAETLQRGRGDAGLFRLATGEKSPLILGDLGEL